MQAPRLITALVLAGVLPAAHVAGAADVVVSHYEPLRFLDRGSPDTVLAQKPAPGTPSRLRFDALGQIFELELEPNDRLLPHRRPDERNPRVALYRGRLADNAASWARITVYEGLPRGLIWDGSELYAIEAPGDSLLAESGPVIYRLSDTWVPPGVMSCAADGGNGATLYKALIAELGSKVAQAQAQGASLQLSLGAVGDYEFSQDFILGPEAAILTRLNNVDGYYSDQLGVQLSVDELVVFTDPADPFSDTLVASDLLAELGSYRDATPAQRAQGLTHLYTGRNLDTTTVGIAYTDALCSRRFGAGLSEARRGVTTDSLIAAHEIGHNFGAPHDNEAGSACEAEPPDFLMAPSVNGSSQFSQCSIAQIQPNIDAASCIVVLVDTDMSIGLSGPAPSPPPGGNATITFIVGNQGTETATTVAVDVSIPNNFGFVSAGASAGSCMEVAGGVLCQLGDVAGGSNSTVTVTAVAPGAGSGTFVASVSADVDTVRGNNSVNATVTVSSGGGSDGGGGATEPLFLVLLGLAGAAVRRSRPR